MPTSSVADSSASNGSQRSDALQEAADALAARVSADVRASFLQAAVAAQQTSANGANGRPVAESFSGAADMDVDRRKMFHDKQFQVRESLLTEMLTHSQDDSYRAIYHALIASLIWLGIKLVLQDYHTRGIFVDFNLLTWAFDNSDVVMRTWVVLQLAAFLPISLVQWMKANPHSWTVFNRAWTVHFTVALAMYVYASWVCISARLPPASGMIVMCEVARLTMKMHAYMREKVVHGLRVVAATQPAAAPTSERSGARGMPTANRKAEPSAASTDKPARRSLQDAINAFADFLPASAISAGITVESIRASQPTITIGQQNEEIGRYVYFLFCPTIVYRDSYPKVPGPINWLQAGVHMAHLVAVMLYTYVIIRSALTPTLATSPPIHPIDVVLLVQSTMLPAMLTYLLCFFGILHSWLNLFAELLKFGDRQFYHRWWSATSWSSYYRRWNMVVGDWLHVYVYQDLQRLGMSQGRSEAGVFIISAIVHELIIGCAFRFWMPALLLMFGGPGVWFMRLTRRFAKRFANIFMWAMLSVGLAMLTVLYSRELYARYAHEWADDPTFPSHYRRYDPTIHPSPEWTAWGYLHYIFVPRSWIEYTRLWQAWTAPGTQ